MVNKKKVILSPHKILLLAAIGFAQTAIFLLPYITYTFYKPMQTSLNITNEQLGFLLTLYGILEVASYVPGGWLADKFNPKKMITLGLILIGLCCLTAAFIMNYNVYLVIWVIVGISANLIYWSAGMKSVRVICDADEQGKAYGYFYLFVNGTTAAGNAIGVAIIAAMSKNVTLGLKYVMLFFAALAFIAAIIIWTFLTSKNYAVKKSEKVERTSFNDILDVLKRKETWYFGIVAFCLYSYTCLATYFTPYFTDVMHLSVASAGAIWVVSGPLSALFGPIMGTISDFLGSTMKTIIGAMMIILVTVLVMLYSTKISFLGAIVIYLIVAIISMGIYSIMFASVEESGMDRKVAGISIGVASVLGYCPDVFIYTMFGKWLDKNGNYGYTMIFKYGVALAIIAIIFATLFYISSRRKEKVAFKESKLA